MNFLGDSLDVQRPAKTPIVLNRQAIVSRTAASMLTLAITSRMSKMCCFRTNFWVTLHNSANLVKPYKLHRLNIMHFS